VSNDRCSARTLEEANRYNGGRRQGPVLNNDTSNTGGPGGTESPQNRKGKPIATLLRSSLGGERQKDFVIHHHWDWRANEPHGLIAAFIETRGLRPLEHPWGAPEHERPIYSSL
jgi:hypothetical protein